MASNNERCVTIKVGKNVNGIILNTLFDVLDGFDYLYISYDNELDDNVYVICFDGGADVQYNKWLLLAWIEIYRNEKWGDFKVYVDDEDRIYDDDLLKNNKDEAYNLVYSRSFIVP